MAIQNLSEREYAPPARRFPAYQLIDATGSDLTPTDPCFMGFCLFIVVNAALYLKPQEIFPDLAEFSIYLYLILGCFTLSVPVVLSQLRWRALVEQPVTFAVVMMVGTVLCSHLQYGNVWQARESTKEYLKIVLYFLLLVGLVTSSGRLLFFLNAAAIFILGVSTLALLHYYSVIELPGMPVQELLQMEFNPETGEMVGLKRMVGTGFFNDPNDLALITIVGLFLGAYFLFNSRWMFLRPFWLGSIAVLGTAFTLTLSRGGFIGLGSGMAVFAFARFGWKKSIPLLAIALPGLLFLLSGRMTDISVTESTGFSRVELWRQALQLLKSNPVLGIGVNQFQEEAEHVAHNTYVQNLVEMGLVGGTMTLAAFLYPHWALFRLRKQLELMSPECRRLYPYIWAILAAYTAGLMSLSRNLAVPTYMIPGVLACYLNILKQGGVGSPRLSMRFVGAMGVAGAVFLVMIHFIVRYALSS